MDVTPPPMTKDVTPREMSPPPTDVALPPLTCHPPFPVVHGDDSSEVLYDLVYSARNFVLILGLSTRRVALYKRPKIHQLLTGTLTILLSISL